MIAFKPMECKVGEQLDIELQKATLAESIFRESLTGKERTLSHYEEEQRLRKITDEALRVFLEHRHSCPVCRRG